MPAPERPSEWADAAALRACSPIAERAFGQLQLSEPHWPVVRKRDPGCDMSALRARCNSPLDRPLSCWHSACSHTFACGVDLCTYPSVASFSWPASARRSRAAGTIVAAAGVVEREAGVPRAGSGAVVARGGAAARPASAEAAARVGAAARPASAEAAARVEAAARAAWEAAAAQAGAAARAAAAARVAAVAAAAPAGLV